MLDLFKRKKTATATVAEPAAGAGSAAAARPRQLIVYGAELDQETTLARELLDGRGICYRYVDVTHDEGQRHFVRKHTNSKALPQLFLDEVPIGDFQALRQIEYRGDLDRLLGGEIEPGDLAGEEADDRGDLAGHDFDTFRRRLRDGEVLSVTTGDGGTFDVWAEVFANPPRVYYEGTPHPIEELDRIVRELVGLVERGAASFVWKDDD